MLHIIRFDAHKTDFNINNIHCGVYRMYRNNLYKVLHVVSLN